MAHRRSFGHAGWPTAAAFALAVALLSLATQSDTSTASVVSSRATPDPLCATDHQFDYGRATCVKVDTQPATVSCPAAGSGEVVSVVGHQCVTTRTETAARVAGCLNDSDDPPAWSLSGTQCTRTVEETYQVQTGQVRVAPFTERVRVAPFTQRVRVAPFTQRVRVAPFTERVRVAPFTQRVRVAPFTERVRVAPFTQRVRVAPFTERVRVAPFTRTVTVHVTYTYKVKVKDGCIRWDHQNGGCRTWRYRTVTRTACCRTETRTESVYNYEDRAVYNYEDRDVFNYETRDVFNYEDRDVYNYEDRDVFNYETRDVFNYEERASYNYEDRDVFNYAPVYETRTRQVAKTRDSDLVCPDSFDPVHDSESCSKQTVTTSPANHDCPATHPTKVPVYMCQRTQLTDPTGCPTHVLVEVNSGWLCRPSNAAQFGHSGGVYLANDARHSYVSIESDTAEHNLWHHRFQGPGGEHVYDPTDLELYESAISNHGTGEPPNVDVRWHVTPTAASIGEYRCDHAGSSGVCISSVILIHPDTYSHPRMTELLRNNLVCHELGHTVGFQDGGTSKTSCMTDGRNNMLDQWEIRAINLQY